MKQQSVCRFLLVCLALLCVVSCPNKTFAQAISNVFQGVSVAKTPTKHERLPTLSGVCFSPYRKNQSPDNGVFPTEEEIRQELEFVKESKISNRIRIYSCMKTLASVPTLSQKLGIECWPGAWLSRYHGPTEREVEALIEVGKKKLPNWVQYSINLDGVDTSSLLGGFCISVNNTENPNGCTFYLDDIVIIADEIPAAIMSAKLPVIEAGDIWIIPTEIAAEQKSHIRESHGTYAYECFTDADYTNFQQNKVADELTSELMAKTNIQAAILTLRKMPSDEIDKTLDQWRQPLHKTWRELGKISAEGQTEAGQSAEIVIANTIINAIQKRCHDPNWHPATAE